MSGTVQYRVNRKWQNSGQPGVVNFRMFWELLNFFDAHSAYSIISYGTGATEGGTGTPTAWLTWNDPPPMGENSWFVVRADLSSATLNGDGTRQWQVKFQVANSVAYADTSGSDKGLDGVTGVVAVRLSPDGGWVGGVTRDFVAVVDSGDLRWSSDAASDEDFNIHFAGDNETVVAVGQLATGVYASPNYGYQRLGYIGELTRRNANHPKPEYLIAPYFVDAGGAASYPVFGRGSNTNEMFSEASVIQNSFSLAADGSAVNQHMHGGLYRATSYISEFGRYCGTDPWSGEEVAFSPLVRQYWNEHQSLLGQLRFVSLINAFVAEGNLFTDNILSCGYNTTGRSGLGFPWPGATTFPLF